MMFQGRVHTTGSDDIFDDEAFSGQIGKNVPLTVGGQHVGYVTIVAAEVVDGGRAVLLTYTAPGTDRCGSQPSSNSSARCERPSGHTSNNCVGRTRGGYWKSWTTPDPSLNDGGTTPTGTSLRMCGTHCLGSTNGSSGWLCEIAR